MPKIQFDVNIANCVAIDIANEVLPVWWMEVYPFCFKQSKSLLHAKIKWFWNLFGMSVIWNDFKNFVSQGIEIWNRQRNLKQKK